MKLKNSLLIAIIVSSSLYASEGEALFKAKCSACHMTTHPTDLSKLVAPPIMGVARHVKMKYPKKEDAVKFMVDYVLNPAKEKALCMPARIKLFGLMPSQKGAVTKEELKKITSWIYDNFPKAGFKGMGQHKGDGKQKGCAR